MQELNFDIASEFLVMAATLLHWKSKAILPQENTQQDQNSDLIDAALTPEQLMLRLLEHQRYRAAGDDLASLPHLGLDFFVRTNKKIPNEKIWDLTGHAGKDMNITSLAYLYQNILIRQRKRKQILKKETVSLAQKITDFSTRLQVGKITEMQSLIEDIQHRPEVVVTFLASLELSRLKKMKVYQEKTYDSIYVELLESLQNFNATMATGFDSVMEAMGETATRPADTTASNPTFQESATL
jgi:segregation and condensation protein A